jgi:hypothetical protein
MADFASWKQETLAKFATEVNAENEKLREDNRMLLAAWRKAVSEKYLAEALAESQGPALPPQSPAPALVRVAGSQR